MHRQITLPFEVTDVRANRPLAEPSAPGDARDRRIAAPCIVGMVRQREHDKPLGGAKGFTLEDGGHDLDTHSSTACRLSTRSMKRICIGTSDHSLRQTNQALRCGGLPSPVKSSFQRIR